MLSNCERLSSSGAQCDQKTRVTVLPPKEYRIVDLAHQVEQNITEMQDRVKQEFNNK